MFIYILFNPTITNAEQVRVGVLFGWNRCIEIETKVSVTLDRAEFSETESQTSGLLPGFSVFQLSHNIYKNHPRSAYISHYIAIVDTLCSNNDSCATSEAAIILQLPSTSHYAPAATAWASPRTPCYTWRCPPSTRPSSSPRTTGRADSPCGTRAAGPSTQRTWPPRTLTQTGTKSIQSVRVWVVGCTIYYN